MMPARTRLAWCLSLALATQVGCDGNRGGGEMTVTDSAGVAMVANVDRGVWAEGAEWTLEEDLRIGTLEGEPAYQFGLIQWLTADPDGSIYVLDGQAQEIRRFDAEGHHVDTFGRAGSGPGEIGEGAMYIGMGAGDTLVVVDLDNQRVNLYTTGGDNAGSVRLDIEAGLPVVWQSTRSGVVAKQTRRLPIEGMTAMPDSVDAVVTFRTDGTPGDTLLRMPSGGTLDINGNNPSVEIFAAEPMWALTEDLDVLYGMNDDYRILVYHDGRLTRVFSKAYTPQRVTDADRRAVMEGLLGLFGGAVPAGALDQLSSLIRFHETFPVIAAVKVGPQGTYWVQRTRPPNDLVESIEPNLRAMELLQRSGDTRWDVFDSEGRFLGPVEMPDEFTPRYFGEEHIYGVWRDELGVEYVMRLRVVQP